MFAQMAWAVRVQLPAKPFWSSLANARCAVGGPTLASGLVSSVSSALLPSTTCRPGTASISALLGAAAAEAAGTARDGRRDGGQPADRLPSG